ISTVTGSGTIRVTGGTLTLTTAFTNTGVNIELDGGSLAMGAATYSIGTFTITSNATLDMNAGTAQLTVATLNPTAALAVTNWTAGTDKLVATAFTGATKNVIGASPMNRITLGANGSQYTVWQTDNEVNVQADPRVRLAKTSNGGVGTFGFSLGGLSVFSDSITTVTAGVPVQGAAGITGTAGQQATITESGVPGGWPSNPVSASCTDANGASTGNTGSVGTLSGNVLTIPAVAMKAGADFTCTFVNGQNGISGTVFNDGGAPSGGVNSGVPNDGLKNGAEAGVSGVKVSLTNCSATEHASTTTDATGNYSLQIPGAVSAGTPVCVVAVVGAGQLATGAGSGSTALPSGSATTVSGTSFTYTRASQQVAFNAPASGSVVLSFGQVPVSTFTQASSQQGAPGEQVVHAHRFTAGTGGSVVFSLVDAPTPANAGWSGHVYADTGCTGTVQGGATQLHPGATAVAVTQGQQYCVVVAQPVPSNAGEGHTNTSTVSAALTFTNAAPALSASYTLVDTTTVGSSELKLVKQVRNVTQGVATFGASNQARPGDELEYRITYTNTSLQDVTQVVISDTTPAYTTFKEALAGTTPAALGSCMKNTPHNAAPQPAMSCATAQTAGGTGTIQWEFSGTLAAGATGEVTFRVTVD
ncbi:MAG: DUF11 domain-containing protein, partial [Burkholderiaceae bacterium]|nr:DUF11 domain-containing protein [Burkholderiaceae bacterium]